MVLVAIIIFKYFSDTSLLILVICRRWKKWTGSFAVVRAISSTCTMSSTSEWKRTFWNFFILIKNIIYIFIIGVVFIITAVLIFIVTFKSWNQRGFGTFKAKGLKSFSKFWALYLHLCSRKVLISYFAETHKEVLNVLRRLELKN